MGYGGLTLKNCPEIQADLDRHFTECDPTKTLSFNESSFVRFLMSQTNSRGFELQQQVSPGAGKKRQVDLVYQPRILTSQLGDTATTICTSDNECGQQIETYTIDNDGLNYGENVALSSLAEICKENEMYISERIMAAMNVAIRKMDADLVDQLATLAGTFGAGETNLDPAKTTKTVATKLANGNPDYTYTESIWFAAQNAAYCTIPYAMGWGEPYLGYRAVNAAGCCNDGGIDLGTFSNANNTVWIPNRNVPNTFDTNHFVTMSAGATQLLWYNEFAGPSGINTVDDDSYKQTVLFDPDIGIPFDFLWNVECSSSINVHWSIKLAYKLVGVPDDAFSDGDPYEGVTQVNEFVVSNP